jgi:dienelactone hydrolase
LHTDLYDRLIPFIKKKQKIESLGIAGFCWGAIPVFMASKDSKFNYGISFHPSLRLLSFFDIDPIKFGN